MDQPEIPLPGEARHHSQLNQSTNSYRQIADLADLVEKIFASASVRIHPASQLAFLISSIKNLADAWDTDDLDNLPEDTLPNLCNSFRIFQAIRKLENQANIQTHLSKLLKGSLDFSTRNPSVAKDFLFEIETFSLLHIKGLNPQFLEPDIIIKSKNQPISIACKKIYSHKRLQSSLSKAVAQINKSGNQGIAVINIDDLLPVDSFIRATDALSAQARLDNENVVFLNKHEHHFRKYLESSRILACIISTSTVVHLPNTSPSLNIFNQQTLWTVPGISPARQQLLDSLYEKFTTTSESAST